MAKSFEVLGMLIPDGGYVQIGDEFEGIQFIDCKPITKKQYLDGFDQYDAWKAKQEADAAASKAALLDRLGITAEEAALLLA
jgi:Na+-transporting NADH:ubiquinone oxidoreductase subunit NqrF